MKKSVSTPDNKFIRYTLAVLLLIVAVNAFGGGVYGLSGAEAGAAFVCGVILLVWIATQISIIGYVSWMQPSSAFAGLLILLLTWQLPQYDH